METNAQEGGRYPDRLTLPIQPNIHLLSSSIHPSPLYTPLPDYHRRKKQLDFILCSCSIMLLLYEEVDLWPVFISETLCCCHDTTAQRKPTELFQDVSKTALTFFFFLRLTFTPSTDTTMLTFFFLMFFTLNSYCREKTGKHMFINMLVINVWINTEDWLALKTHSRAAFCRVRIFFMLKKLENNQKTQRKIQKRIEKLIKIIMKQFYLLTVNSSQIWKSNTLTAKWTIS